MYYICTIDKSNVLEHDFLSINCIDQYNPKSLCIYYHGQFEIGRLTDFIEQKIYKSGKYVGKYIDCILLDDIIKSDEILYDDEKDEFINCSDMIQIFDLLNKYNIPTLYIYNCNFKETSLNDYLQIIPKYDFEIKNIYFYNNNVQQFDIICNILQSIKFEHLNISIDHYFGYKHLEILQNLISNSKTINTLSFKNCRSINDDKIEESMKEFSGVLQTNTSLTSLDLSEFPIHTGFDYICDALRYNTSITTLKLPMLYDESYIITLLEHNTTLMNLKICLKDYYSLSSKEHIDKLQECLQKNTTLTSLSILTNSCMLKKSFVETLLKSKSLTTLKINLSYAETIIIDDDIYTPITGMEKIIQEALYANTTLTSLKLKTQPFYSTLSIPCHTKIY